MLPDNNIQNELKTLGCTYLTAGLGMPFSVPEGYFTGLPGTIINQVKATDHTPDEPLPTFLNDTGLKQVPYTMPVDYFDQLSRQVLIKLEKEPGIDQPLQTTQQEVPAGYFDSLAGNIMTRIKTTEKPVISLPARKKSWFKYAVAAAVTGLVALGSIAYFTSSGPLNNTEQGTASIDAQVSRSLQSVPEQNLEQMVTTLANETVHEKTTLPPAATGAKTEALVAGLLNEVPTAELASFLTDFDEDADEELNSTLN